MFCPEAEEGGPPPNCQPVQDKRPLTVPWGGSAVALLDKARVQGSVQLHKVLGACLG